MNSSEKTVTMIYQEHMKWLQDRKKHEEELKKFGDLLAEQDKLMWELVKERDDIVVIEDKKVMIQEKWKLHGATSMYPRWESRYAHFPRFYSGDELSQSLDRAHMEMFYAIKDLQNELEKEQEKSKRDLHDWKKMNKLIPINVWGALGKRKRERIRKMLYNAEVKLRKEGK